MQQVNDVNARVASTGAQVGSSVSAQVAYEASIERLEALLTTYVEEESGAEGVSKSEVDVDQLIEREVVDKLGPALKEALNASPERARVLLSSLSNLLEGFTVRGGEAAIQKVMNQVAPVIIAYAVENPDSHWDVLDALSPLMGTNKEFAEEQMAIAGANMEEIRKLAGESEEAKAEVRETLATLMTKSQPDLLNSLISKVSGELEEYAEKNPEKMKGILKGLIELLGITAIASPEKAADILPILIDKGLLKALCEDDKGIEIMALLAEAFKKLTGGDVEGARAIVEQIKALAPNNPVIQSTVGSLVETFNGMRTAGTPDFTDNNFETQALAIAIYMIQQFLSAMTSAQSEHGKVLSEVGKVFVQAALEKQQEIKDKIAKMQDTSIWSKIVGAICAAVGALLSLVTFGVGACVFSIIVAVFMMSPAFEKLVGVIGKAIASTLEEGYVQDYINEGKSPSEAKKLGKQKAEAAGNLIAKICIIAVIAVSGGFVAGGTSAASAGSAVMFGVMQGLGTLASSGFVMDAFMMNPELVQNDPVLAGVISAVVTLVLAVLGAIAGKCAFKGCKIGSFEIKGFKAPDLGQLSKLAKLGNIIVPLNTGVQIGGGIAESSLAAWQGYMMMETANKTKERAKLEADLMILFLMLEQNSESMKANKDNGDKVSEAVAAQTEELSEAVGKEWDQIVRALSSAK